MQKVKLYQYQNGKRNRKGMLLKYTVSYGIRYAIKIPVYTM